MPVIPTHLIAATVYPDRARLKRRGTASLAPGVHPLEITDLPLQMNQDSVRATASGTARARLLGVQVNKVFYTEGPAEAVRELEAQIEDVQDTLRRFDTQTDLIQKQRAHLDAVAGKAEVYAMALATGEMSLDAHLALLDNLRDRMGKLDAELSTVGAGRREAERLLQKLQNELNQQRGSRPRQRYAAVVEVEVLQEGDLAIELSYVVNGAGWQPLYDLRLREDPASRALQVRYLAQVSQSTGEAWENISLTLSTARPALAGRLPELDPWYVQPLPPPMPQPLPRSDLAAAMPRMAKASMEGELLRAEREEAAAEVAVAQVDSSGAAVTYLAPGTVSVPADGAPHKVTVAEFTLPPGLDYVAAPSRVEAAYRRAKVRNDSPYLLLPGAANLFAGEEFIGTTRLDLTPPQGEIELYLGVDDRIKLERELKRREVDKRLIGGKRRTLYGYEIVVENLLPVEAHITIHDQMPLARHEDIKVRLDSSDPRPTRQTELNLLDWEFNLAPGEKRTIRFDFSVEHPQGMEVIGLT